jgi:hypothetical protein
MAVRDLTEIAEAEWTTKHRSDQAGRTEATATLKERLRWKP